MTTSAVAISLAASSRPSGEVTSSVMPRLPRLHWRYIAPMPSEVTGVIQRSSPPSTRSTRMTSAPRSASSAPQYGPAMYRPKSTTRVPSSTPTTGPPFVRWSAYGTRGRRPAVGVVGGAPPAGYSTMTDVRIEPTEATLGAVVTGVRLATLTDDEWGAVDAAFLQYAVLVFPGQHLTEAEQ